MTALVLRRGHDFGETVSLADDDVRCRNVLGSAKKNTGTDEIIAAETILASDAAGE